MSTYMYRLTRGPCVTFDRFASLLLSRCRFSYRDRTSSAMSHVYSRGFQVRSLLTTQVADLSYTPLMRRDGKMSPSRGVRDSLPQFAQSPLQDRPVSLCEIYGASGPARVFFFFFFFGSWLLRPIQYRFRHVVCFRPFVDAFRLLDCITCSL